MSADFIDHEVPDDVAGVLIPWTDPVARPNAERLSETAGLVEALGCKLAFLREEQVRKPNAANLLSGGILERFRLDIAEANCSLAVVDAALSPVQQRNLERILGVKVIDRTGLILEIFGLRARSKEGQLQVELARLSYERSRLVRTWTHLERQRGGRGFLGGPGETQLEADRRMLDRELKSLRRDLEDVQRTRGLQREGRRQSGQPVIALVGYTNAGKSTLFNRLSGADVFARDMPFATLDPTIRRIELPHLGQAALVDTVGFITDLPTHLIDAFRATLEETLEADLIIHVRDRSSDADAQQKQDVLSVLGHLSRQAEVELPPLIEAWNKIDLVAPDIRESMQISARISDDPPAVCVSALSGEGADELLLAIETALARRSHLVNVVLSPAEGAERAWLHQHGDVRREHVDASGHIEMQVALSDAELGQFQAAFPDQNDLV